MITVLLDARVQDALESLDLDWQFEAEGFYRLDCHDEASGAIIADRVRRALTEALSEFGGDDWTIETRSLAGIPWEDYDEQPCWEDETPVQYAVVIACPWGWHRLPLDVQVEMAIDDAAELRRADRLWTLRYDTPKAADPDAVISTLKLSLGWWQCVGLDFRAERCGSNTVVLEIA